MYRRHSTDRRQPSSVHLLAGGDRRLGSLVRPVGGAVHEHLVARLDQPVQDRLGDASMLRGVARAVRGSKRVPGPPGPPGRDAVDVVADPHAVDRGDPRCAGLPRPVGGPDDVTFRVMPRVFGVARAGSRRRHDEPELGHGPMDAMDGAVKLSAEQSVTPYSVAQASVRSARSGLRLISSSEQCSTGPGPWNPARPRRHATADSPH